MTASRFGGPFLFGWTGLFESLDKDAKFRRFFRLHGQSFGYRRIIHEKSSLKQHVRGFLCSETAACLFPVSGFSASIPRANKKQMRAASTVKPVGGVFE